MLHTFEDTIHGGMTFINMHDAEAKNLKMGEYYNPDKSKCSLVSADTNNMYGHQRNDGFE